MSNVTIAGGTTNLPTASTIDGNADYIPIYTASATATQAINRNTFLGLTSQPLGLSDSQSPTNKTLGNTNTVTLKDTNFTLQDDGDTTKQAKFQLSGLTTATTRTYTLPDISDTLVTLTATQTLTNKTLSGAVLTTPTLTNATITTDAITGFTTSNNGTVYGMSVTGGVLASAAIANQVNTAALQNSAVTTIKITDGNVTPAKLVAGAGTTWVWQTWTPSFTGFSANPSGGLYYYIQIGKLVILNIVQPTGGTSNATTYTMTLPVTARTVTNQAWVSPAQVEDNGTTQSASGIIQIQSAGTTLSVFKTYNGGGFTTSGAKGVVGAMVMYEAA